MTTLVAGAALVVPMAVAIPSATAATDNVCIDTDCYATIADALTAAHSDDTITVGVGTYSLTSAITIGPTLDGLTIQGPSSGTATVNVAGASSTTDVNENGFVVQANDVTIKGLNITGPVPANTSYKGFPWYTPASDQYSVGIAVRVGAAGFAIEKNTITNIRTGILVDGRNPAGTNGNVITENTIDNTKGGILVQYTDAGVGSTDGYTVDISGNKSANYGNEWDLITHLNGYLTSPGSAASPPLNPVATPSAPTDAEQQALLAAGAANGTTGSPWNVMDLKYTESNRTAVTVSQSSGDDSYQGSSLKPLASVRSGINAVVAGGTVNVEAGTYDEQVTIDKPLTVKGAGSPVLTGTGPKFALANGTEGVSGVTIEGFTFQDVTGSGYNGVITVPGYGASDVEIKNNTFDNITESAIGAHGNVGVSSNWTITGNHISNVGNVTSAHQYSIWLGNVDTATVSNNVLDTANWGGLLLDGDQNVTVDGNHVTGMPAYGITITTDANSGSVTGITLTNNVVTGNKTGIVTAHAESGQIHIHNNQITGNTTANLTNYGPGQVDATNNWWGPSGPGTIANVTTSPWCVNPELSSVRRS